MTWFPEGTDIGIKASLTQTYPIVLSTLLSINRRQLTFTDVQSALLITSPPLMVYLTIASIGDFLGVRTGLYKRVRSHRKVLRALGALILPLWLALSLTAWLSPRAFGYRAACFGMAWAFRYWLMSNLLWRLFEVLMYPVFAGDWYTTVAFASSFFLCLFRRRSQVMADFRARRDGETSPWGWWRIPWTFTKCVWYVPAVVGARLPKHNTV